MHRDCIAHHEVGRLDLDTKQCGRDPLCVVTAVINHLYGAGGHRRAVNDRVLRESPHHDAVARPRAEAPAEDANGVAGEEATRRSKPAIAAAAAADSRRCRGRRGGCLSALGVVAAAGGGRRRSSGLLGGEARCGAALLVVLIVVLRRLLLLLLLLVLGLGRPRAVAQALPAARSGEVDPQCLGCDPRGAAAGRVAHLHRARWHRRCGSGLRGCLAR
mmetsp:Transcript_57927/g.146929  ORF Transcript_57927/g.146929 Transcript_57927/m.146929 type:complete len:217 (+) Transcript_57927:820-1470(+)